MCVCGYVRAYVCILWLVGGVVLCHTLQNGSIKGHEKNFFGHTNTFRHISHPILEMLLKRYQKGVYLTIHLLEY